MYCCEFSKMLSIFGELQQATIKVRHDGWGEVFDKDELYCGSMNPYKTMVMLNEAAK